MIAELREAKAQDEKVASNPTADPIQAGDASNQAYKAERAIRELEHGMSIDDAEFKDALIVPPPSISPELRQNLIKQLESMRKEYNQIVLPSAGEGLRQTKLDEHAHEITAVINDLEIGEGVPWTRIQHALAPPKFD